MKKEEKHTEIYSINLSLNTFCGSTEHFTFHYGTKAIQHLKSLMTFSFFVTFYLFYICSHGIMSSIKWALGSSHKWVCKISFFSPKNLPKLRIVIACMINKYLEFVTAIVSLISLFNCTNEFGNKMTHTMTNCKKGSLTTLPSCGVIGGTI